MPLRRAKVKFFASFLSRKGGIDEEINMYDDYVYDVYRDYEDAQDPDSPCEHDWEYSDDAGGYVCTLCDLLEPDPSLDEDEKRRM